MNSPTSQPGSPVPPPEATGPTTTRTVKLLIALALACLITVIIWYGRMNAEIMRPTETPEEMATIRADLIVLQGAVITFTRDQRRLPASLAELVPKYIDTLPRDPYGRDYVLHDNGPKQGWIWCLGANGELSRYPPDTCAIVNLDDLPSQ